MTAEGGRDVEDWSAVLEFFPPSYFSLLPYYSSVATPEMSDITTDGVRVGATAYYLPEESDSEVPRHVFGYTIVIVNNGDQAAQLVSRKWLIVDGDGTREEVEGPGVVGQTPRLKSGEAFKYQSFCPLKTTWGTMEGSYQMRRDDGSTFDVRIERFYLRREQRID